MSHRHSLGLVGLELVLTINPSLQAKQSDLPIYIVAVLQESGRNLAFCQENNCRKRLPFIDTMRAIQLRNSLRQRIDQSVEKRSTHHCKRSPLATPTSQLPTNELYHSLPMAHSGYGRDDYAYVITISSQETSPQDETQDA